jgi:hypothetical protein
MNIEIKSTFATRFPLIWNEIKDLKDTNYATYLNWYLKLHPIVLQVIDYSQDMVVETIQDAKKSRDKEIENYIVRDKINDPQKILSIKNQRGIKMIDAYAIISFSFQKLVTAFSNFLKEDDKIEQVEIYKSIKGLVISSIIIRDNQSYFFTTECIYAGGYNIQCLHVRYITKTNLPSNDYQKDLTLLGKFKKAIALKVKIASCISDIEYAEKQLQNVNRPSTYYKNTIKKANKRMEKLILELNALGVN